MSDNDLAGRIATLATPVADELGVDLVDVEVKGQRGSRVVRLVADAPDGLGVDRIAELSRRVGDAIDDLVDGRYTLEVTSPGVDRPLRSTRDFVRNLDRQVRLVRTREAIDRGAAGEVTGTLTAADDAALTLEVAGETVIVALDDVDHGKVVLPW
jgi:ribosome maturation factor RimP